MGILQEVRGRLFSRREQVTPASLETRFSQAKTFGLKCSQTYHRGRELQSDPSYELHWSGVNVNHAPEGRARGVKLRAYLAVGLGQEKTVVPMDNYQEQDDLEPGGLLRFSFAQVPPRLSGDVKLFVEYNDVPK